MLLPSRLCRRSTAAAEQWPRRCQGRRSSHESKKTFCRAMTGRKRSEDDCRPSQKRIEQNRAAQKAFRQRKEQYVRDLEEKITRLEGRASERDLLFKRTIQYLHTETMRLSSGNTNSHYCGYTKGSKGPTTKAMMKQECNHTHTAAVKRETHQVMVVKGAPHVTTTCTAGNTPTPSRASSPLQSFKQFTPLPTSNPSHLFVPSQNYPMNHTPDPLLLLLQQQQQMESLYYHNPLPFQTASISLMPNFNPFASTTNPFNDPDLNIFK